MLKSPPNRILWSDSLSLIANVSADNVGKHKDCLVVVLGAYIFTRRNGIS